MNEHDYIPENQINEDCLDKLITKGKTVAICQKKKGHKGRHGADFIDGSSLKWSHKKTRISKEESRQRMMMR